MRSAARPAPIRAVLIARSLASPAVTITWIELPLHARASSPGDSGTGFAAAGAAAILARAGFAAAGAAAILARAGAGTDRWEPVLLFAMLWSSGSLTAAVRRWATMDGRRWTTHAPKLPCGEGRSQKVIKWLQPFRPAAAWPYGR